MRAQLVGGFLAKVPRLTPARVVALLAAMLGAIVALGLAASAASAATFSNTAGITINDAFDSCTSATGPQQQPNDAGTASPYPSSIAVSGLGSSISHVNVTVRGLSHTFPEDVGLLLVSPAGQSTILMTDSGGGDVNPEVNNIFLTFDDAASAPLPDDSALPTFGGTFKPTAGATATGCLAPGSFPKDATGTNPPAGPYAASLSVFNGTNPNGIWKLYVIDDTTHATELTGGSISGGWSLDISASTPADTTPPTVTDTSPKPGDTASKTDTVTATFSEPVQNVSTQTFILERQIAVKKAAPKYVLVDATVTPSDDGLSAVLDPVQDLPKGDYRTTITTDVTDLADNTLDQDPSAGNQPRVWTFTVKK